MLLSVLLSMLLASCSGQELFCGILDLSAYGSVCGSCEYTMNDGTASVTERHFEKDGHTIDSRLYEMPSQDIAFAASVRAEDAEEVLLLCFDRTAADLHWSDGTEWHETADPEGSYDASCLFVDTEQENLLLYMPMAYAHIENGCVRYLPDRKGYLDVTKNEDGSLHLELYARGCGEEASSDFFLASCRDAALDWSSEGVRGYWRPYTNDQDGRFLYDGYYWITPETYEPHGEDVFANWVASYFVKSFVYGSEYYDVMQPIRLFMIDTVIRNQNEAGFWPSNALSTWLQEDYGIGPGYYDTRFNSDFADILMKTVRDAGGEEILEALDRYCDFYVDFAGREGWELGGGLAVPDYYFPGMKKPHMSLNHQLAETEVLYQAAMLLDRSELTDLADLLLAALEGTAEQWIMPDGNLEYAIYPDGQFGGKDYPYLTYDDLYNTQALLESMGRERSESLQLLMDSKQQWMDRNGITGYKR